MDKHCFAPREICALEPRAFGALFAVATKVDPQMVDGIAVLKINGPLTHHASPLTLSYEEIVEQVRGAVAGAPRAVVLRIDSPGGLVSGCFDAAREIRALCSEVPLYVHVSGQACSAAYALACLSDEISLSPTAVAGSIGVLDAIMDVTASDEKQGIAYHILTSGARKADGNPHAPVEAAALAAQQAIVDEFAEQFFALVASGRGLPADQVRALDAGVFPGRRAVEVGLADHVETYSEFFARISAGKVAAGAEAPAEGASTMPQAENEEKESSIISQLRKAAESENEEEAKLAKKALAALEDDKEPEAEAEDEKKEEAKAEDSEREPEASSTATILSLSAKVAKLEQEARMKAEAEEKQALLASRPDLPGETLAWLKTQPVSEVKKAIKAIPQIQSRAQGHAATAVVPTGVQGAPTAGVEIGNLEAARARLGIRDSAEAIRVGIHNRQYHTLTPSEARALLEKKQGGAR